MAGKAKKSKWFRVAREGATSDGRKIEGKWLREIAQTFDPAKYGARIFMEHIRPYNPNAQHGIKCMGDVTAVKVEEEDGKAVLYAQISPTDDMVALVADRQKIYTSIEVAENFANSGMAYLVGLGITDSPASLGTDVLEFASKNPATNLFANRKSAPGNMIVAAEDSAIEFEDVDDDRPGLLERVRSMFARARQTDDARFADVHAAVEEVATQATQQGEAVEAVRADNAQLRQEFAALKAEQGATMQTVADLSNHINHTPANDPKRPVAPGTDGAIATDC